MAALAVMTKNQLQLLRGVRKVSIRVQALHFESKRPLIQEDDMQDLVGDSSEEQRSAREPSGL